MAFINDLDRTHVIDEAEAEKEIQLTPEMIETVSNEFGAHASTARDLFSLRKQLSLDDFRDWVNAVGYLQMLQNALAHGIFEKKGGIWRQAIVQRCATQQNPSCPLVCLANAFYWFYVKCLIFCLVFSIEKQKRRHAGFLNKMRLRDSSFRHLSLMSDADLTKMAESFLQAS